MTLQEAEDKIKRAGFEWNKFWKFMSGKSIGRDENNEAHIEESDVDAFIEKSKQDKR